MTKRKIPTSLEDFMSILSQRGQYLNWVDSLSKEFAAKCADTSQGKSRPSLVLFFFDMFSCLTPPPPNTHTGCIVLFLDQKGKEALESAGVPNTGAIAASAWRGKSSLSILVGKEESASLLSLVRLGLGLSDDAVMAAANTAKCSAIETTAATETTANTTTEGKVVAMEE